MRGIQQSPSLWTETYWHKDVLFLILDQFSITYRDENPMYAQCIQSNFVSKYKVSWDVLMAVTLSGSSKRQNLLIFFDVFYFLFCYQWQWWKLLFFCQIQLCVGYFATSWDQVQWPGARPSCMTILLSPSLRQLSSCLSPVHRGQWEWSLHLQKGVI